MVIMLLNILQSLTAITKRNKYLVMKNQEIKPRAYCPNCGGDHIDKKESLPSVTCVCLDCGYKYDIRQYNYDNSAYYDVYIDRQRRIVKFEISEDNFAHFEMLFQAKGVNIWGLIQEAVGNLLTDIRKRQNEHQKNS